MMARMSSPRYKDIVTTSRTQVKTLKKTIFTFVHSDCQCTADLPLLLLIFLYLFLFFLGAIDELLDLQPEENGMI